MMLSSWFILVLLALLAGTCRAVFCPYSSSTSCTCCAEYLYEEKNETLCAAYVWPAPEQAVEISTAINHQGNPLLGALSQRQPTLCEQINTKTLCISIDDFTAHSSGSDAARGCPRIYMREFGRVVFDQSFDCFLFIVAQSNSAS